MSIEVKFVGDSLADVQKKMTEFLSGGDTVVRKVDPANATMPDGSPIPKPKTGKTKKNVVPGKRPKPGQPGEDSKVVDGVVKMEDVRESLGAVMKADGNNERVFEILGEFGVQKISDLDPENYQDCKAAADAALVE